jgi:hypothetical protein
LLQRPGDSTLRDRIDFVVCQLSKQQFEHLRPLCLILILGDFSIDKHIEMREIRDSMKHRSKGAANDDRYGVLCACPILQSSTTSNKLSRSCGMIDASSFLPHRLKTYSCIARTWRSYYLHESHYLRELYFTDSPVRVYDPTTPAMLKFRYC